MPPPTIRPAVAIAAISNRDSGFLRPLYSRLVQARSGRRRCDSASPALFGIMAEVAIRNDYLDRISFIFEPETIADGIAVGGRLLSHLTYSAGSDDVLSSESGRWIRLRSV